MQEDGSDIEKLLEQRAEIDRRLFEQHARRLAVLFTDIVGSTDYFERKGDIEGLSLVHRHNQLLFPVVESHGGRVVKTIGDAILAVFENPVEAVRAAVEMQEVLVEERGRPGGMPIRIRIGIHLGTALLAGGDVFGDAVNTAARVVSQAGGEEVLVSEVLAREVAGSFTLTERGSFQPKGKNKRLRLYAVRWSGSPEAEATRSKESAAIPGGLVLELGPGPRGMRVLLRQQGIREITVRRFIDVEVTPERLVELTTRFKAFMDGGGAEGYRELIEECGRELAARVFPEETRQKLTAFREEHLILSLDETLVAVPWELAVVGEEPLSLKFATGRMVATSADAREGQAVPGWSSRILVVADAAGNLAEAAREGKAVAAILRKCFASQVELVVGPVKVGRLKEMLGEVSLLHVAGHAGQGGEIACADGTISVDELVAATGSVPPALVFANSCYSTSGGGFVDTSRMTTDMASRFLLKGCRHFLGPLWSVADGDALSFALRFYEKLVSGHTVGESVREARKSLHDQPDSGVAYASYVLYGDPRERLPANLRLSEKTLRSAQAAPAASVRDSEGTSPKSSVSAWTAVTAMAAVILVGLVALLFLRHGDGSKADVPLAGEEKVTHPSENKATVAVVRQGPVRLCVLPFKNLTGDSSYDFLKEGMTEAVVTDFGSNPKIRLIERGQIDLDIKEIEFSNSKYVDPATRARLGKIVGAEVVVLGAVQKAQGVLRAQARFVNVETGEILLALKVERPEGKVFELQDALSEQLRTEAVRLVEMLRR